MVASRTGTYVFEGFDASDGVFTSYSITPGDTFVGTIGSSPDDDDWVRINLRAGENYVFYLGGWVGSRTELNDPTLYLRDSQGNYIDYDDDGGYGLSSLIQFTATTTGTYFLEVGGFGFNAGDYSLETAIGYGDGEGRVYDYGEYIGSGIQLFAPTESVLTEGRFNMTGDYGAASVVFGGPVFAMQSEESAQVWRLYQATLDRHPDPAGHAGWTDQLMNGSTLRDIVPGFLNSPEFQSIYGFTTNQQFVTLLYQNVLDRTPDAAGLQGWVDLLDSGTLDRARVVLGFSESPEFVRSSQAMVNAFERDDDYTQTAWTDEVYRLFQATLDRAPALPGLLAWTDRLTGSETLEDMVPGFLNSPEFQSIYGSTSNQQFVTLLYQNVLDRAPDAAGLLGWVNQLNNGVRDRAEVVILFSQSNEFILASADDLRAHIVDLSKGPGGDDVLSGGFSGVHNLFGGMLSDTFLFQSGTQDPYGRIYYTDFIIHDFEVWDVLEFQGFGYSSADDFRARMYQDGDDVVFSAQFTTVRIEDTRLSDITDDQFVF